MMFDGRLYFPLYPFLQLFSSLKLFRSSLNLATDAHTSLTAPQIEHSGHPYSQSECNFVNFVHALLPFHCSSGYLALYTCRRLCLGIWLYKRFQELEFAILISCEPERFGMSMIYSPTATRKEFGWMKQ